MCDYINNMKQELQKLQQLKKSMISYLKTVSQPTDWEEEMYLDEHYFLLSKYNDEIDELESFFRSLERTKQIKKKLNLR